MYDLALRMRFAAAVLIAAAATAGAGRGIAAPATTVAAAVSDAGATRGLAHDIFRQLIEINTTDSSGDTTAAAAAMAQRLTAGGFAKADVVVLGPRERKGNLVVRYRGRAGSRLRPILIIGHLDVVEARREDWSTDPFKFVEQDGYYYGRGTQDMKSKDAIVVADFIRLKRAGYVPNRDLILALTADEEDGDSNGVQWLFDHHRDLVDAEYVINPDVNDVVAEDGKVIAVQIEAAEKLYADYALLALNAGGHSSMPKPDNAIYHIADALGALEKSPFPFELNVVTRAYFEKIATVESAARAADIRTLLTAPDGASAATLAAQRLSADARTNSILHTTCVATMVSGGHAFNALPQRAEANVNCRILPGHSQEEIRQRLIELFNDAAVSVRYRADDGTLADRASERKAVSPSPPRADLLAALTRVAGRLWPGAPVIPYMENWATDSMHTVTLGIPSYGISGVAVDRDDQRMHGKDERVRIEAFYTGLEFYYEFLQALTGPDHALAP